MADINKVMIEENRIRYNSEVLKVSNISRTWIFKYQNIEKRKFEEEKLAYQNAKAQYEANEAQKKKENVRKLIMGAVIAFIVSLLGFSSGAAGAGVLCLCITGGLAYLAYSLSNKENSYPYPAPTEKMFPDKFGLGIEMNSGYRVIFTAIGNNGVTGLRKLQNDIEEADVHKGLSIFNMNDYNISVENNDGIINTGDFANNDYQKKGQDHL